MSGLKAVRLVNVGSARDLDSDVRCPGKRALLTLESSQDFIYEFTCILSLFNHNNSTSTRVSLVLDELQANPSKMSNRYNATPMDWEFQNGTGPIDYQSPFAKVGMNNPRIPPPSTPSGTKSALPCWLRGNGGTNAKAAGSHSSFNSPARPQQSTAGASRRDSPNKPLPPVPAWNSLYTTPRKIQHEMDDSSAGETPKSPERYDDSEAGTPVDVMASARKGLGKLPSKSAPVLPTVGTLNMSPSKEMGRDRERERQSPSRRESLFGRIKNKFASPGRGEIPRGDIAHGKEVRVRKQKSREAGRQLARQRRYSVSDSGSDVEADESEMSIVPKSVSPRKTSGRYRYPPPDERQPLPSPTEPHFISKLFKFIGDHPTVPQILIFWAQMLFNLFCLCLMGYILYGFLTAIQGDVDKKAFEASADVIAEIKQCAKDYTLNKCDPATRAPALTDICNVWAKCAARDPAKIARARVSAQSFAEILNAFMDALSYKTIVVTCAIVFGSMFFSNVAFNRLRNMASAPPPPWTTQYAPPPTPQRQFSGQDGGFYGGGTPWHNAPGLEPQPSGGFAQIDGRGSPVRKLAYN